jgi:hypothetical protein
MLSRCEDGRMRAHRRGNGHETPLEFLLPAGFVRTVGACAVVAPAFPDRTDRVTAMVLVTGAFAAWARRPAAGLATAAMGWLLTTGFLVNTAGELSMSRADDVRMAAFAAAALAGIAWAQARDLMRSARSRRRMRARGRAHRPPVLARRLHPESHMRIK